MNINLYQIQYDENTAAKEDSGIFTYDCRGNPEFLKREIAHLIRFYDEVVVHASDDEYFGLFSPKFELKTRLTIPKVKSFICNNPGRDIYLFNPCPMHVFQYLNMWEQGEEFHKGLVEITDKLLQKANINFSVKLPHRQTEQQVVYCNYWVAKKTKFDEIIYYFKLLNSIVDNDQEIRQEIFDFTEYAISQACFYPFVFERLLSTFLYMNKEIDVLPYSYKREDNFYFSKLEKKFYFSKVHKDYNNWELTNMGNINEVRNRINIIKKFIYPQHDSKLLKSIIKRVNLITFKILSKKLNLN